MKSKSLFIAVLFLGVSAGTAFGQVDATVAVSADVVTALDLSATPVAFGTIQIGEASYLQANANDGTEESNLGTAASPGSLQITGEGNQTVLVSWDNATLHAGGTESVIFTPTIYNGASLLEISETTGGSEVALPVGGVVTLDIGGGLPAISTAGAYTTANAAGEPVTLTVQYNQ